MSCILMTDEVWNDLHTTFSRWADHTSSLSHDELLELVRELRLWNYAAYNFRYKNDVAEDEGWRTSNGSFLTDIEVYKILLSIQYQCYDAPDFEDSKCHRKLQVVMLGLASVIINSLEPYRTAQWAY